MNKSIPLSPLLCLSKAQLTPSGLLLLDRSDGEVELMRREEMELRCDQIAEISQSAASSDRDVSLVVTLTTHRLVVSRSNSSAPMKETRFLHLSNVHAVNSMGGARVFNMGASHKISIATYSMGEFLLVFRSSSANKDRADMLALLQKTLERRAWETASRLQEKKRTSESIAKRRVGVDAILAKSKLQHTQAAKLTDQAFGGDAETLLREAKELVTVIRKYARTLEQPSSSSQTSDTDNDPDAARLAEMMQDMGMASALSKSDHRGSRGAYYETLARQLSDFLSPKLKKIGGLMTLTDVYCLFNRARGTNLISPQELVKAVDHMGPLLLGMSLRVFSSGVKVVQDDSFDPNEMAQKLQVLARTKPLTALAVSRELHISALLAHEQLVAAEQLGYLCRDVILESTRFYLNRFVDFAQ